MNELNTRPKGTWISVREELPPEGTYWVVYYRDNEKAISRKKLIRANGESKWFGGCRPFSDNDNVSHWLREDKG